MFKTLLVSMPFSTTKWPSISISLLKSKLVEAGLYCDIRYFNLDFAALAGVAIYDQVSLFSPFLLGERIFTEAYFGPVLGSDEQYIQNCGLSEIRDPNFLHQALGMKSFVNGFLDNCLSMILQGNYDCVGFTNMFEQTMASMALAKRIKESRPGIRIVMGGANCEGEMGIEIIRNFPCIDVVCRGESDFTFPEVIKRFMTNQPLDEIPSIIYRQNDETKINEETSMVFNVNTLSQPDYDDYFEQLQAYRDHGLQCTEIHMETSRGCWWGAKKPCRFCGLNGKTAGFRSKDAKKVLIELEDLIQRYVLPYQLNLVSMTDNILDPAYFKTVIPELAKKKFPVDLFYEVKANLSEKQLRSLVEAGVIWIQPGIESLNTDVLNLMGKGVSGINNIRLLKFCAAIGIYPTWNIIYGFPGEKEEHYRDLCDTIAKIMHFPPPEGFTPLALQRFSVFFNEPEHYGIINVRPEKSYEFIFPFNKAILNRLVYFFEYEYHETMKPYDGVKELASIVGQWSVSYENGERLTYRNIGHTLLRIEDTRSFAVSPFLLLEGVEKEIYEFCWDIQSFESTYTHLCHTFPAIKFNEQRIRAFLAELVSRKVMVTEHDLYLSLALKEEGKNYPHPSTNRF